MGGATPVFLAAGVGLWLGGMLIVSCVVAPAAFWRLGSRELAAELVTGTLNGLYLSGYVLGPLLVFVRVLSRAPEGRPLWKLQAILLVMMTVASVISREIVGTKLLNLRRAMGPVIDTLPPDDSLRLLFRQWHQVSVLLMLFSVAAALAVLALLGVEERSKASHGS